MDNRQIMAALLVLITLALSGCGAGQNASKTASWENGTMVYHSEISVEDCYLCGNGNESLLPAYWGQKNIALISLNSFDIMPIDINRYDRIDGRMIEEYAGLAAFCGGRNTEDGFYTNIMVDYDRGYAAGSVDFYDDTVLDIDKTAAFLCADCLNEILPQRTGDCFGVGVIDLETKKVRIFEEKLAGFTMGDFYVGCNFKNEYRNAKKMNISIFYCPVRYEEKP